MKITVSKIGVHSFSLEMESTDTIAHLKAKVEAFYGVPYWFYKYHFICKQLGDIFMLHMKLSDIGVQEGSIIYINSLLRGGGAGQIEGQRQLEYDRLYDGDVFKSGWREEHGKVLLGLLLQFCQDGVISEGNIRDKAWHRIKKDLKNSTNSSFQIDFLKGRLEDYKKLYSLLAKPSSHDQFFHWDRENKKLRIASVWMEYHPELFLLCGAYIPYFDTLEKVCLLLSTKRSSEKEGSKTSSDINNENSAHLHRDLRGTMMFFIGCLARAFSLECKRTDTIAYLKERVYSIEDIPPHEQRLMIEGIVLDTNYEERTLRCMGIPDQSKFYRFLLLRCGGGGKMGGPPPGKGYLYYADAFKSGWTEDHCKVLLCLVLQHCQDGTISEGNITDNAWLRIQNGLKNSTNCGFQIDFLKDRLHDYKQLYSLLVETNSPVFRFDRENKTISVDSSWRMHHPELLLLCQPNIPYFDTLEEVCSLLNSRRSSKQQVSETLSSINNVKVVHQDIPRLSNASPNRLSLKRLFRCFT